MNRTIIILTMCSALVSTPAMAFIGAGTDIQMLVTLGKQLQIAEQQFSQLKAHYDKYKEFEKGFKELERIQKLAERASDRIRHGDINGAIRSIKYGLSTVSSLSGIELPSDIDALKNIIMEAQYGNDDGIEVAALDKQLSFIDTQETLMALRDATNTNIEATSKDVSINSAHVINATNTSILARLAVEEHLAKNAEEQQKTQEQYQQVSSFFQSSDVFEALAETD